MNEKIIIHFMCWYNICLVFETIQTVVDDSVIAVKLAEKFDERVQCWLEVGKIRWFVERVAHRHVLPQTLVHSGD